MKTFEELANATLDGTATPAEQAALTAMLERDTGARERFRTLELAVRAMSRVRDVEVPIDLKDQILDAVRAESPPWSRPRPVQSPRRPLGEIITRALGLRLAAAFAAGIAAGVIAFTLATGGRPLVQGPATGTMAPQATPTGIALVAGEAQATVEMSTRDDLVTIRVAARSAGPAIVEVSWPSHVGFVGFESDVADSDRFRARAGLAVVEIAGPTFDGVLRLRGGAQASEIGIRLRANRDVDEATMTAPPASR